MTMKKRQQNRYDVEDLKPAVLGAVSKRSRKDKDVHVLTGTATVIDSWEQCDPGDPCAYKDI